MNLVNEKAATSDNEFIRNNYKYDLFLQLVLSTVNGVTLGADSQGDSKVQGAAIADDNSIVERNETPIANMYVKVCHRDFGDRSNNYQETLLTNQYQELIVDVLLSKMTVYWTDFKEKNHSDESKTFVPYYDSIVEKSLRSRLSEIKLNPYTLSMVMNHTLVLNVSKS